MPEPSFEHPSLCRFNGDEMEEYAKAYAAPLIARVAELEAENAKLRDADMFWNDADPEMAEGSIFDVIDREWGDGMLKHGDLMEIQQATRLPNIKVRLVQSDDGEDYFDYEIVDAAIAAKD